MIKFNLLPFEKYIEEQRKYLLDQKTLFEMLKKGYAPLNFDADSKKQAKMIARKLLKEFKKSPILFRKSPSRRGYHFTIFDTNGKHQLFLSIRRVLEIRKKYHDCYGRLDCDFLRSRYNLPIGILFNHKAKFGRKVRYATNWKPLRKIGDIK